MKKNTMSDKVRAALIKYSPNGEPVTLSDLALELDMVSNQDKRPLHWALRDMRKSGEVERIEPGVVAYRGLCKKTTPDIREAMWAVLRMRQSVTIADLQELAGASKFYAREFMAMLVRRGSVESIRRKDCSIYRLIKDTGPQPPEDNRKIEKLRAIRKAKKQAIEQLDAAGKSLLDATQAIARARMAVNDIPEEADHE